MRACALLLVCLKAFAGQHLVGDFGPEFGGTAADSLHLDPAFGDSLIIRAESHSYTSLPAKNLTDSLPPNGKAGGTAMAAATGPGNFKVAYIGWPNAQAPSPGLAANPGVGDIIMRTVSVDQGVVTVGAAGTAIAGQENKSDPFTPRHFYGGPQQTPPPVYFNFAAAGNNYVAYWSSLTPRGPLRRTSFNEAAIADYRLRGTYVWVTPPNSPVVCGGYGEVSAVAVPGSNATRTVLAYEDTLTATSQVEVRWEDLTLNTTVGFTFNRPVLPEDFAVAADSAGNALVAWRENAAMYLAGFDSSHALVTGPTQIVPAIYYREGTVDHFYRPYAVAAHSNGNFLIAYGRNGNAKGTPIYLRTLSLPAGTLGAETPVTNVPDTCRYPSIAVNSASVLVGWYEKFANNTDSIIGALYNKQGAGIDTASRLRLTLSPNPVSFSTVGTGWYIHHAQKTPGLAMDERGNIAIAYDNEFWTRIAFVANTDIYYDSAVFTSKTFTASNPAVASPYGASDSLELRSLQVVTAVQAGKSVNLKTEVAVSDDGSFTDAGSAFGPFAPNTRSKGGNIRYRFTLYANGPANISQTKVDSLALGFNVKPRAPKIDSIRIGGGAMVAYDPAAKYVVLPRKDSVRIVCSGVDIDNESLTFRIGLGANLIKSVPGSAAAAAGGFQAAFTFMPPDTALNPLPLRLTTLDPESWASPATLLNLDFVNRAPAETLSFIHRLGLDSAGSFWPGLGARDTLVPARNALVAMQAGDTAVVKARFGDGNDDSITVKWLRNGVKLDSLKVAARDTLTRSFVPDTLPPIADTLTVIASDKDTAVTFKLIIRANRLPKPDSVYMSAYQGKDLAWKRGTYDKIRDFAADTGLTVPLALPTVLAARVSDPDESMGDKASVAWALLKRPAGCAQRNLTCYQRLDLGAGDTLLHTFAAAEEYLLLRAKDSTGAFREKRILLEYPVLDTVGSPNYNTALKSLSQDLDFVLEGQVRTRTVSATIISQGNIPLQITSVKTQSNDAKWMAVKLAWTRPGNRPDSLAPSGRTDANPIPAGSPVVVAAGAGLTFDFRFFSDSLRGDSVLTDTLLVATSDFANPILKIPFRIVYNDLPLLRIGNLGGQTGTAGGFNDQGLPKLLPVRTRLVFGFSEPVVFSDPAKLIRIYSKLDSAKNPAGYAPIAGTYAFRHKPLAKIAAGDARARALQASLASLAAKAAAAGDSVADTVIFTPAYDRVSDSLKVRPRPGAFIHKDILHIAVSNGITDRAGNALDLRLDRAAKAANTVDTIFEARIDTGYVRVVSTLPAAGAEGWDPEAAIRIRFNHRLMRRPARAGDAASDSLTLLNLDVVKGDSSHGVWITSVFNGGKRFDFARLSLEDGDSTLVLRERPKFPALDTITVHISGGITDIDGLTLDGNEDGFPGYLYDSQDSTDAFTFTFTTLNQAFYVYPNPFRWQDARHREKGAVTFKNINSIKGYRAGQEVFLRIHTMTGDLVYSSKSAPAAQGTFGRRAWTSLDWNLTNNAGNTVGTGVYLYTLIMGETTVLRKGKVAVVR